MTARDPMRRNAAQVVPASTRLRARAERRAFRGEPAVTRRSFRPKVRAAVAAQSVRDRRPGRESVPSSSRCARSVRLERAVEEIELRVAPFEPKLDPLALEGFECRFALGAVNGRPKAETMTID